MLEIYLVCAPGLEPLLGAEARALGLRVRAVDAGGVTVDGDLADVVRANIGLRTASRVLVRVASFRATAFHELERSARRIAWDRFVGAAPLRVRATCRKSKLYHSDAVAERVLGAIERATGTGEAPSPVHAGDDEHDEGAGAQLIVVRFYRDECTISIDSSGALLHRRGYRQATAKAPLRETLAAAMLLGAEWTGDTPLVDPLCGAGTIPIEAALIARRIAPGRARAERGELAIAGWPELPPGEIERQVAAARGNELAAARVPIVGSDRDAGAIEAATANAERAGVSADVRFVKRVLSAAEPVGDRPGLLVANPPYGVRLSEGADVRNIYAQLGKVAHFSFPGWRIGVLSPDRSLESQTRLALRPAFETSNGGIRVRYLVATSPAAGVEATV